MAQKTLKEKRDNAKYVNTGVQWFNVTLSDEDIQVLTGWISDAPDLLTEYVRLVGEGNSLSVKPARDGNGYMATLISPPNSVSGECIGVSAYAADAYGALACLLFKFVSKMDGAFPNSVSKGRTVFR